MKKTTVPLVAVSLLAIFFCHLWVREITEHQAEMERRCQRYAEDAAGHLVEYEAFKDRNDESHIGQYWGSVGIFYAFMDTLYSLPDNGGCYENGVSSYGALRCSGSRNRHLHWIRLACELHAPMVLMDSLH